MAETLARDLRMNAGSQQVCGVRVSEIVETNPFQASLGHKPSKGLREAVRPQRHAVRLRHHMVIVGQGDAK